MSCVHEHSAPVEVQLTDTVGDTKTKLVARICTSCFEQLPSAWGCEDCEWVEERRLCSIVPDLILAQPCAQHAPD